MECVGGLYILVPVFKKTENQKIISTWWRLPPGLHTISVLSVRNTYNTGLSFKIAVKVNDVQIS